MAIAVDSSTPARWTGTWNGSNGGSITSASFTAPADALLVLCATVDTGNGATSAASLSASDSGGLTWTKRVERLGSETTAGGGSAVFTARTTSSASRTVTLTGANPGAPGGQWGTGRASAKLYVLTGVDVDGTPVDTVGANNEGGSAANPLNTTSITPGANGLLVAADTDWSQLGAMTSSDLTLDTADYAGAISVASGYKACTSGVGVTGNFDPPAGTPQHKWTQVTVREASGGAAQDTPELYGRPFGTRGESQQHQLLAQ